MTMPDTPGESNFSFEYRNISHVAPKADYASYDEFRAAVMRKYEELDRKGGRTADRPGTVIVQDVAEQQEDAVEPETKDTIGQGVCPTCNREFQRLDMHVCKGPPKRKQRKKARRK